MNRKHLLLLGLLAAALTAAAVTLRSSRAAHPVVPEPTIGAIDSVTMQANLRFRQCQPRHWRYVMLRQ